MVLAVAAIGSENLHRLQRAGMRAQNDVGARVRNALGQLCLRAGGRRGAFLAPAQRHHDHLRAGLPRLGDLLGNHGQLLGGDGKGLLLVAGLALSGGRELVLKAEQRYGNSVHIHQRKAVALLLGGVYAIGRHSGGGNGLLRFHQAGDAAVERAVVSQTQGVDAGFPSPEC